MSLLFILISTFYCYSHASINASTIWANCITYSAHAATTLSFGVEDVVISGNVEGTPITGTLPSFGPNFGAGGTFATACGTDKPVVYAALVAEPCTVTYTSPAQSTFGTQTLTPGVYCADSFSISAGAVLTLNGQNIANAQFIFRAANNLDTSSSSSMSLRNLLEVRNVFWVVGSSATIGDLSTFIGQIVAVTDISVGVNASVNGRIFTTTGAVSINNGTSISLPTQTNETDAPLTNAPIGGPETGAPTFSPETINNAVEVAVQNPSYFSGPELTVLEVIFEVQPTAVTDGRIRFIVSCPNVCNETYACAVLTERVYTNLTDYLTPSPCLRRCLHCMLIPDPTKRYEDNHNQSVVVTVPAGYNSGSGIFVSLTLFMVAMIVTLLF